MLFEGDDGVFWMLVKYTVFVVVTEIIRLQYTDLKVVKLLVNCFIHVLRYPILPQT